MVSAVSDSAELFMASVICMGTRLMRRAAKRRSIVTLGFLGLGEHENSVHVAVLSLRKLRKASSSAAVGQFPITRANQAC
jgi:hypothetical protein